jgi:hypothetical protein
LRRYIEPEEFTALKPLEAYKVHETPAYLKGGTHKGASQHLRAFGVGQLVSVTLSAKTCIDIKARRCGMEAQRCGDVCMRVDVCWLGLCGCNDVLTLFCSSARACR